MRDMSESRIFLRINIERDRSRGIIKTNQRGYLEGVLQRCGKYRLQTKFEIRKAEVTIKPHSELIGCLM